MARISDKILGCIATAAEDAFWEALGLASKGGAYEPKMSDEINELKANHTSKIETIFNKVIK